MRRTSTPLIAPAIFVIPTAAAAALAIAVNTGRITHSAGIASALVVLGLAYHSAALVLWAASLRLAARQRQVWRLLAAGCMFGGVGWFLYAWLMTRGLSFTDAPPTWLGVPRAGMYVCWFYALWLLRQPLVSASRRTRIMTVATELAALGLVGVVVLELLWQHELTLQVNLIALGPVAMDLLLIAAAYHAVRRASLELDGAHVWLVIGFILALGAHIASGFVMAHGLVVVGALTVILMAGALASFAVASGRKLLMRETILGNERVTGSIATIGLAVSAPAAAVSQPWLLPIVFGLGSVLAWRVYSLISAQGQSEIDPLTGLHDNRSIQRHISSVAVAATRLEPIAVVGVDLDGFGRWNAEHGFAAGDQLLTQVAERCVAAPIGPGVWGRIGPDRFYWVGHVADGPEASAWAELIAVAAADPAAAVSARCGVVMCPTDAATAANVIAAMDEALEAAARSGTRIVAFDRGLLDGYAVDGTYSASFRSRRERIAQIIQSPTAIRPVFQPIVRLGDFGVVGHEALTRFDLEPRRGPDEWIAEAHQLGLGLEMESECMRRALSHVASLPDHTYLSLNCSPQLILSGLLDRVVPDGSLHWLLIELTEHDQVADYGELAASLAPLRARGARVAVDDLGAGHSTLRHVVRLDPDYAKLDRSIVESIDADPARRALVRSMLAFSTEMGCPLVAEGVERDEELETLREIGVDYGQGYLFQRPGPAMVHAVDAPGARSRPRPAGPGPVTPPVVRRVVGNGTNVGVGD